ncbi:DAK2 domain-containing protein [Serinicoccus sp. LYQ131]|uniref:DAK2 domain-containing protein n=1 Tax=Serinicoccus sp. LYQ131 TaxID=3378797 RepID=UPI003855648A
MSRHALDLVTARRWAMTARLSLGAARERIDALNVFPVADGDTGTNMYLTLDGALEHVRVQLELGVDTDRLQQGLALIARGMLLSARGNSGVILAQLTRGLADAVGPDVEEAGPHEVAAAFEASARTAWDALAAPVEGTILTVARAAGAGARAAVDAGADDVTEVVDAAHTAARAALARTPELLPELGAAGVVDAGGAGLLLVVEALQAVLAEGPVDVETDLPQWWHGTGRPPAAAPRGAGAGPGAGEGAMEVMYLLTASDPERADRLRTHLAHLGDSVAVAGGPEEYQVHVHLEDPSLAVEAGSLAGVVGEVRLSSLDGGRPHDPAPAAALPTGVGVVACALGAGVVALFEQAGAAVVPSGPRHRASAGQLLAAVRAGTAAAVVVLPNDEDTVMVARAAALEARHEGLVVEVVPTRTLVEGLAALAVHDPAGRPADVVAGMAAAVAGVHGGALTRAERAADTPVGRCRAGQWLGIVDHEIVAVADTVRPAARAVLETIWHPGAEVVTVLEGQDATAEVRAEVAAVLDQVLAGQPVEVTTWDGGQPTYPVLLGVE